MEIKGFAPQTVKSLTLPMQELRLMPIGDIQFGSQGCDVDRLKRHIAWGVEHECHFIGMGDYLDVMSPSNRRRYVAASLYDSVREALNAKMAEDERKLEKLLAPTKGRWFGLIRGHHYYDFEDGSTSVSRLASFLGCSELGDCGVVILRLKDQRGRVCPVKIWAHHGAGSSVMAGGALNRLERMAGRFFAHIYLMGHQHTKPAVPVPFIDADTDKQGRPIFHSVNRYLVATGGFLKGYEAGSKDLAGHPAGSYIEQGMLVPVTLGGQVIYIRPRFRHGRPTPDINVSI